MTQSGCFPTIPAFRDMPPWRKTLFGVEYFHADNSTVTGRKINGDMQHYRYDKRGQLLSVTLTTRRAIFSPKPFTARPQLCKE